MAVPEKAASTWCHMSSERAISPMARTGSTAVVPVVPTVLATNAGVSPPVRSAATAYERAAGDIAWASSVSTRRR